MVAEYLRCIFYATFVFIIATESGNLDSGLVLCVSIRSRFNIRSAYSYRYVLYVLLVTLDYENRIPNM